MPQTSDGATHRGKCGVPPGAGRIDWGSIRSDGTTSQSSLEAHGDTATVSVLGGPIRAAP